MRVAHLVRKSSQLRSSFIRNQILEHIDYDPVVVSLIESEEDNEYADFEDDAVPRLSLRKDKSSGTGRLSRRALFLTRHEVTEIISFLAKYDPSVLHLHYGSDAGIYYPLVKKLRIPSVVSFYGYDCSGFPSIMFGMGRSYLKARVFHLASKVLAMSPDMENDLVTIGCPRQNIVVHYYGSDVGKFFIERTYQQQPRTEFVMVSGLEPQKGHIFLLKAFKEAYADNKALQLEIYGSGRAEDEVSSFIRCNNMDYVYMHGPVRYGSSEHVRALRSADVFIHPSVTDSRGNKEGIPGAVVEAMAAGLPVISTFHAGIPHIIRNGETGLLVKEWDVNSLKAEILRTSGDLSLRKRLGQNAQKYAVENLDLLKREKELEKIYDGLAK